MRVESTSPSSFLERRGEVEEKKEGEEEINWTSQVAKEDVLKQLEKIFYPFKKVPYHRFNETFLVAGKQDKLVHHILLWGSLDDQSC